MAQVELLPEVTKFIEAPKMVIAGRSVDATSGDMFDVINPATGQAIRKSVV